MESSDRGSPEILARSNTPALDKILGKPFPVLDQGFVRLIDYMGDEASIVQAARVSYGKGTKKISEDRGLLRYLMRQQHTTPFEMCELKLHVRVPMDCWRQWIRHRTACLSGDTMLQFDLPGGIKRRGNQLYKLSVKDIYNKFQPTANKTRPDKQRNPYHKKEKVQKMNLRCVNEETHEVTHTKIVDIWESGVKTVYRVSLENGAHVKMSEDHLCFTDEGWKKLKDITKLPTLTFRLSTPDEELGNIITVGPGVHTGVPSMPVSAELDESWRPVVGWETYYEVSDYGRVRRIVGGRGSRSYGRCKKITVSKGRAVVSMNRPGEQVTNHVHSMVLAAFIGPSGDGQECCHENGNALDNRLENLRWDTPQSNADDRVRDGATTSLQAKVTRITSIQKVGQEMTYDIEVGGPWHNFSANGMIVHNSVNEYSTRYSEAINAMQQTSRDSWRLQSTGNRQGSSEFFSPEHVTDGETTTNGFALSVAEDQFQKLARRLYESRIEHGVAREQARKDLPLSSYTEAYWKIDLKNLLGFLALRMDSHAQKEIRDYATVIGEQMVALWLPNVWEAFNDYHPLRGAVTFTRLELDVIKAINSTVSIHPILVAEKFGWMKVNKAGTSLRRNRERSECEVKLEEIGLYIPWEHIESVKKVLAKRV